MVPRLNWTDVCRRRLFQSSPNFLKFHRSHLHSTLVVRIPTMHPMYTSEQITVPNRQKVGTDSILLGASVHTRAGVVSTFMTVPPMAGMGVKPTPAAPTCASPVPSGKHAMAGQRTDDDPVRHTACVKAHVSPSGRNRCQPGAPPIVPTPRAPDQHRNQSAGSARGLLHGQCLR